MKIKIRSGERINKKQTFQPPFNQWMKRTRRDYAERRKSDSGKKKAQEQTFIFKFG